ncbi:MAG: hypothetical protein R2827_05790, partial [Bdellovibrionales bacterium]
MKEWSLYSDKEREELSKYSPAASRYQNIVSKIAGSADPLIRLKYRRHQAWLNCAYATYFKTESTKSIASEWSHQTFSILQEASREFELDTGEIGLFAMGKLGSYELNLSSDIDLIWISEKPAERPLIKKVSAFTQALSNVDEFGFCYRVDYDLRPGGRLGPLISSLAQAENYYWSQGETWERIALLRLSPALKNIPINKELMKLRDQYCFRKYSDFNLLESLQQQRSKIRQFYNFDPDKLEDSFHLKLSPGGIRDIELFFHVNLILHGGKDQEIRALDIESIAHNLAGKNLINKNITEELISNYWKLRHAEHFVQLENDQQTHMLTTRNESPLGSTLKEVSEISSAVNATVSNLLGEITSIEETLPAKEEEQKQLLADLGFKNETIERVWPRVLQLTAQSTNPQRDESYRKKVLFRYIKHL